MFLGWYDPDRKKPARQKLAEAVQRYSEKFGRAPQMCLTSEADAADLVPATKRHPDPLPVTVEPRRYIARWTFYVGDAA